MSEPTVVEVNPAAAPKEPLNEPTTVEVNPAAEANQPPLNQPIEIPGQREAYANALAKLADHEETTAYQGLFHAYLRCVSVLCLLH